MKSLFSRDEYEQYLSSIPKDSCLLCNVKEQILLGESKQWYWIANIAPYWKYHTMLIPKNHREDITELDEDEFSDFKRIYFEVKTHLLALRLMHEDRKPIDQFLLMVRVREDGVVGGSTYPKPKHLHFHLCPDREGTARFALDPDAKKVDIFALRLGSRT